MYLTSVALGAGRSPVAVAVTPDGRSAYIANSGNHTISVMDTATNTITATITLPTGAVPYSIAITPDGTRAYVANSGNHTISVITTATNTITATITLPTGAVPYSIAITPDGTRAYVANTGDDTVVGNDTVSVITTTDDTITATISGFNRPHGIAITPDGTRAYIANTGDDTVIGNDTVSVITTTSNTITATISDVTTPEGVAVSVDGTSIYVSEFPGGVITISTATNTISAGTNVLPSGLIGVAVGPGGGRIYAAASTDNSLAVLGTGARVACSYAHSWPSGGGTTANPYRVASQSDLNAIRYCPSSAFILTQDIALTGSWTPIGTRAVGFTGTFDGDGHTITGLVMDNTSAPSGEPVGLFGMAQGATMRDLTISGGQVSVTRDEVGLLVGNCEACEIASVEVTGTVTVAGNRVGGLAGLLTETTSTLASSSSAAVVQGNSLTGGLAGLVSAATVTDTCASGAVTGTTKVGGLAGGASDFALLDRTCATGAVTGSQQVGGLVGVLGPPNSPTPGNAATINRSFASGNITATDPSRAEAGGLVGTFWNNNADHRIANSFATGSVVGAGQVGGLVGSSAQLNAITATSYAVGALSGPADNSTGGAFGKVVYTLEYDYRAVYWNTETTGRTFGLGGLGSVTTGLNISNVTGLTSEQMRYSSNFAGWDFTSVWGYDCQRSLLPQLRWYVPTATASSCPPATPNSGPVTPTSSPTPTTSTTPTSPPVPAGTSLKPGRARATIGGVEVPVRTTALRRGRGTVVTVGSMRFTLRSTTPSGQGVPTSPNGALVVARSGALPITGEGVAPGSEVKATLYSNPIPLGLTTATASGSFASQPTVPATVPRGTHTLSLTGSTTSGAPFTLNLGVTVESPAAALGAHPVVSVQPHPARVGDHLTIRVAELQAGCVVSFTLGRDTLRTQASARGQAQATLVVPVRSSVLTTRVHGKRCIHVKLQQKVKVHRQ